MEETAISKLKEVISLYDQMSEGFRRIEEFMAVIKKICQPSKPILTLEEFCDYAGISKSNGYRLISEGRIRYSKPNGKLIYIRKEDADDYLAGTVIATDKAASAHVVDYLLKSKKNRK